MLTTDELLAQLFEAHGYLTASNDGEPGALRLNIYSGEPSKFFVGPIYNEGFIYRILTAVVALPNAKKVNIAKAGLMYLDNERKTDPKAQLTNKLLARQLHNIHLELEEQWRQPTS